MMYWSIKHVSIDEWEGTFTNPWGISTTFGFHNVEVPKVKEMLLDAVKMRDCNDAFYDPIRLIYFKEEGYASDTVQQH